MGPPVQSPHTGGAGAHVRTHAHHVETRFLSVTPPLPVPTTDGGTNVVTSGPTIPGTASIVPNQSDKAD